MSVFEAAGFQMQATAWRAVPSQKQSHMQLNGHKCIKNADFCYDDRDGDGNGKCLVLNRYGEGSAEWKAGSSCCSAHQHRYEQQTSFVRTLLFYLYEIIGIICCHCLAPRRFEAFSKWDLIPCERRSLPCSEYHKLARRLNYSRERKCNSISG